MDRGRGFWILAVVVALLGARGLTSDSGDANEPKPAAQKPVEKTAAAATSTTPAADSEWARCDARLVGPIAEFENVYGKKPRPLIALVDDRAVSLAMAREPLRVMGNDGG